jgi:hypothetical protein
MYPEKCDSCGQPRTCNDAGLCHECQQAENESAIIVIDGEEYIPGGFAL